MTQPTLQEVLHRASLFLEEHNREPRVAELLLLHHLQFTKTQLLMAMKEKIPSKVNEAYQQDIHKHVDTGIPIQHLTGYEDFYGRTFHVSQDVLIPRPETEELVVGVLDRIKNIPRPLKVVDIGTGSGIIAITLKLEDPSLTVEASDISTEALQIARKNAATLNAEVTFKQSDFLQKWLEESESVDVIISNPPYIAWEEKETLADTVKNFDPSLALFAESDGLAAYQQIIVQAKKMLSPCGLLAFEIGYQQAEQVKQLILTQFPNSKVEICQDINGRDRMVFAKMSE
ncbi:release factor glutamine methyltransferase [Paraliobacillus quinghaiensis]|uniref:Release factor glutamine methyltransferase n=1 Tax=Paraliobacillus quinghaiensis TaxID=470815 RepID=A0A917WVP7_9BACI|nr:peptide chain release factor N(5)-glutamine methyltransferase [Paraliobacillus quinghaiensis]GGM32758.1 release factor glutamine methyltransferase [Paraliobacillus quinghaiensis]